MYSPFQLVKKYILYYLKASSGRGYGIHSPFVFDFIQRVLNDASPYDEYNKVEFLRRQLLADESILDVEDLGAGSATAKGNKRKIGSIIRSTARPKKIARLLFRVVRYYRPLAIIELGTSAGLTTAYLALANPEATIITLEGASQVAALARKNFQKLEIANIMLVEGNFDFSLPKVLASLLVVNFAFVDGNHRKAPTLHYFNQLLARVNTSSVLIFDDIHWSEEMEDAWENIKSHKKVRLTIDLFFLGLVFFKDEFKTKQHFIIRY